jgi:hypothetical protein
MAASLAGKTSFCPHEKKPHLEGNLRPIVKDRRGEWKIQVAL